jgi:hypothetical protein
MKRFLEFALTNFTLTLLVIGLVALGVALLRAPKPLTTAAIVEALFSYFLLFSIGVFCLYNFIAHTVFAKTSARLIGWENSPFELELGFASLGFAVIGFLAFRGSFKLRLSADPRPSLFPAAQREYTSMRWLQSTILLREMQESSSTRTF